MATKKTGTAAPAAKKAPAAVPPVPAAPAAKKKNRVNSFSPSKIEDHTIVDADGKTVGHIRVKPSGIAWAPVHSKVWYGVSLDQLGAFAINEGKKQKK